MKLWLVLSAIVIAAAAAIGAASVSDGERADLVYAPTGSGDACVVTADAVNWQVRHQRPRHYPWRVITNNDRQWHGVEGDFILAHAQREQDGSADPAWFPPFPGDQPHDAEVVRVAVKGPSVAMARAFLASAQTNGATCLAFHKVKRPEGGLAKQEDLAGGVPGLDSSYPESRIMVGRAVISPTGDEAMVYVEEVWAPLSAWGGLILYRKGADGRWRIAGLTGLWVS